MSHPHLVRAATVAALSLTPACVTVVHGNERALFYSAANGVDRQPVASGWYWHWPWNHYVKYDLRWKEHTESIDLVTKDGLHLDATVTTVVRPAIGEICELDATVGPDFYANVVRPAVAAAARDGSGQFTHVDLAKGPHELEQAIKERLIKNLEGRHVDIAEIVVQHLDMPQEVIDAANRTAASEQLLGAKKVDLELAQKDSEIQLEKRRGTIEADGLERRLKAEQDLAAAEAELKIEEAQREVERAKAETEADAITIKADADAKATIARAEAEKQRIRDESEHLTPNYVRLQALDALARAMSGGNTKLIVVPAGANGLPAFFAPFLDPYGAPLGKLADGGR